MMKIPEKNRKNLTGYYHQCNYLARAKQIVIHTNSYSTVTTVQSYSTVQSLQYSHYSTVQYSTVTTVQYSHYSTVVIQYSTVQSLQYSHTVQ